jgi:Tol biopolymer transport system component
MDADGGNHKQITESGYAPTPSSDGRDVFYLRFGDTPSAIWKTSIEGENAVQISQLGSATAESFLSASPGGDWLAYHHVSDNQNNRGEDGTTQIGVIATDGSGEPKLFDVSRRRPMFHWTSDDAFDYVADSSSLWRQPINGEAKKLVDFPDRVFNFAWSIDGKNLAVSRGRLHGDAVLISNLP